MTYRTFDGTSQVESVTLGRYTGSTINISDGSATKGAIYFSDDTNTGLYSPANDNISFTTAGTERLRVNGSGDFWTNNHGTAANALITAAHSDASAAVNRPGFFKSTQSMELHAGSGTASEVAFKVWTPVAGAVGSNYAKLQFSIDCDGDTKNTNNSYAALSDSKLKQDVVDAPSQWADIKAVKVKKYKMKDEVTNLGADNAAVKIGVIAQDLEAANMNGLVKEYKDVIDGVDQGTTTKSVKYSILYMKAIKALQEAQTRIETLETKVAALESA